MSQLQRASAVVRGLLGVVFELESTREWTHRGVEGALEGSLTEVDGGEPWGAAGTEELAHLQRWSSMSGVLDSLQALGVDIAIVTMTGVGLERSPAWKLMSLTGNGFPSGHLDTRGDRRV
ncbi:hypothetical protein [Myxococcus qinghaiensis]|uniref:hypothetical protein n=1 Tax=Myxococcus qinghaiensis TaxID=2906758 RepID=UPI0020A719C6|nr:hypothetical protein [Myxococcus qinghaiensis]MCP3162139.1 hypothetical protein [Myxococcus qinghaiensis]